MTWRSAYCSTSVTCSTWRSSRAFSALNSGVPASTAFCASSWLQPLFVVGLERAERDEHGRDVVLAAATVGRLHQVADDRVGIGLV